MRSVGGVLNAYPFLGRDPVGGYTAEVCDAWPVRRQQCYISHGINFSYSFS